MTELMHGDTRLCLVGLPKLWILQ